MKIWLEDVDPEKELDFEKLEEEDDYCEDDNIIFPDGYCPFHGTDHILDKHETGRAMQ